MKTYKNFRSKINSKFDLSNLDSTIPRSRFERRFRNAYSDYEQGCSDCKSGLYDNWYINHRYDDGVAYHLGWCVTNLTVQNEDVKYIERYR